MSRASEAARKAYPPIQMNCDGEIVHPGYDKHTRNIYQEGYEQAEKDTIERAVKWLEENVWEFTGLGFQIFIESFKNAMK